jgi:hypothetical protein
MISLPSTSTRTMTDRRWRSLIAFRTVLLTAASWVGLADGPVPFVVAGAVPLFMPHTVSHALRSPRSRAGQSDGPTIRTAGSPSQAVATHLVTQVLSPYLEAP